MLTIRLPLAALALLLLAAPASAATATVRLKAGGVIYGTIEENLEDRIVVAVEGGGKIVVLKRDIARVEGLETAPPLDQPLRTAAKTELTVDGLLQRAAAADGSVPLKDRVQAVEELAQRNLDSERPKVVAALLGHLKALEEDPSGTTPADKTPLTSAAYRVLSHCVRPPDLGVILESARGELGVFSYSESGFTRVDELLARLAVRAVTPESRELLLLGAEEEEDTVRWICLLGLLKIREALKPEEVPDLFAERDPRARQVILELTARLKPKELWPVLKKVLSEGDPEADVYLRAMTLGRAEAGDELVEALYAGTRTGNRELAISGLLDLGWNARAPSAKARATAAEFNRAKVVGYDLPNLEFRNFFLFESGGVKILYGEVANLGGDDLSRLPVHAEFFCRSLGIHDVALPKVPPRSVVPFRIDHLEPAPADQVLVWFGRARRTVEE